MSPVNAQELKAAINTYVSETLKKTNYIPQKITESKIIRCSVFGFNVFRNYEINLIDSPFLQRLPRNLSNGVGALHLSGCHTLEI